MDQGGAPDQRPATPGLGAVLIQKILELLPILQRLIREIPALSGGFFGLIINSPELIMTTWNLYKFVMEADGDIGRAERIKKLKEAVEVARNTKDTTKLTELFNGGSFTSKNPTQ